MNIFEGCKTPKEHSLLWRSSNCVITLANNGACTSSAGPAKSLCFRLLLRVPCFMLFTCWAAAAAVASDGLDNRGDHSGPNGQAEAMGNPLVNPGALVQTALGTVQGVTHDGADVFLGLPYALPPIGDLRFAPAVEWTQTWAGARDATRYRSPCHQTTGNWDTDPSEHPYPSAPLPSEDCLYLNIFRPQHESAKPLPVMVWIHGGGFCTGSGALAWANATRLAREQNTMVVTLDYRLGPLGFLALPELRDTYGANGGLNGVRDQLAALRWLQRHVGAFGGDVSRVTVWGESSGGVSVCVLNASPAARGLFSAAIIQSGPCIVSSQGWGPHTPAYGERLGSSLAASLAAPTLAALRALPPQRLQWSNETLADDNFAGYCVDGHVLDEQPFDAYAQGNLNARRLVVGATSKDGTAQFYGTAPLANASAGDWAHFMHRRWGAKAAQVMARYPLEAFNGSPASAYIEADADERVVCPTRLLATMAGRAGVAVFHFSYAHFSLSCDAGYDMQTLPWWEDRTALRSRFAHWASHGADVHYVFGTTHGPDDLADNVFQYCPFDKTAGEEDLVTQIQTYWTSFARGGEPNGSVAWPRFTPSAYLASAVAPTTSTMRLGAGPSEGGGPEVVHDFKQDECSFWGAEIVPRLDRTAMRD